jgi:hypothetical protein
LTFTSDLRPAGVIGPRATIRSAAVATLLVSVIAAARSSGARLRSRTAETCQKRKKRVGSNLKQAERDAESLRKERPSKLARRRTSLQPRQKSRRERRQKLVGLERGLADKTRAG